MVWDGDYDDTNPQDRIIPTSIHIQCKFHDNFIHHNQHIVQKAMASPFRTERTR